MNPERHSLAHRRSVMSGVEPLLVQCVPGLVHHAEKSVREISRLIARRNPDISGTDHRAERMRPEVEAAALQIESKFRRYRFGKRALSLDWKFTFGDSSMFSLRPVTEGIDKWNELRPELLEQSRQLRGRHVRLVVVQQRIVPHVLVSERIGLLAREGECLIEKRREALEVVPVARLRPRLRRKR